MSKGYIEFNIHNKNYILNIKRNDYYKQGEICFRHIIFLSNIYKFQIGFYRKSI